MKERQSPATIFLNERERRARDLVGLNAQSLRDSPDKCGFSGAEISREEHDRSGRQDPGEIAAHLRRLDIRARAYRPVHVRLSRVSRAR